MHVFVLNKESRGYAWVGASPYSELYIKWLGAWFGLGHRVPYYLGSVHPNWVNCFVPISVAGRPWIESTMNVEGFLGWNVTTPDLRVS